MWNTLAPQAGFKVGEDCKAIPSPRGALVGLSPQTQLQTPQIEIWNTIN